MNNWANNIKLNSHSQTEKNPKENVKAIILRSGKEVRVDKGEMAEITHEEAPKYVPPHARQSEKKNPQTTKLILLSTKKPNPRSMKPSLR